MPPINSLALFDFDGTITRKDSLTHALKVIFPAWRFWLGWFLMVPVIIVWKLNLITNHRAKELVLIHFFKGMSEHQFIQSAKSYSLEKIPGILRPDAMEKLNWHLQQGHEVWVVTASIDLWLKPWTDSLGVNLISTTMEVKNGKMTGKLSTPNNFGPEKARRIREVIDLTRFNDIYAYGDTEGDREMLALATFPNYRVFKG
ncbi:MAG: HAD-IB family hydrolase [Bacteroidetes bacterium]|nr:HAD-IB family hydrolase [Bacteroidota bacterium]